MYLRPRQFCPGGATAGRSRALARPGSPEGIHAVHDPSPLVSRRRVPPDAHALQGMLAILAAAVVEMCNVLGQRHVCRRWVGRFVRVRRQWVGRSSVVGGGGAAGARLALFRTYGGGWVRHMSPLAGAAALVPSHKIGGRPRRRGMYAGYAGQNATCCRRPRAWPSGRGLPSSLEQVGKRPATATLSRSGALGRDAIVGLQSCEQSLAMARALGVAAVQIAIGAPMWCRGRSVCHTRGGLRTGLFAASRDLGH